MAWRSRPSRKWCANELKESSEGGHQWFREAVKPIYGITDKGNPEHIGSALLLDLPERCFLLTAAMPSTGIRQPLTTRARSIIHKGVLFSRERRRRLLFTNCGWVITNPF